MLFLMKQTMLGTLYQCHILTGVQQSKHHVSSFTHTQREAHREAHTIEKLIS